VKFLVAIIVALTCSCSRQAEAAGEPDTLPESEYHSAQSKIFRAKEQELVELGRFVAGNSIEMYIGSYAQHSSGKGQGWFGAYTFSPEGFEQAKQSWVFDGYMLPGSDLLWVSGRGIKFDKSVIGRTVSHLTPHNCYADDGNSPCEKGSVLHSAGVEDAVVLDVFGHQYEFESWGSDGSHERGEEYWRGPLRLSKKSPTHVAQWGIELLPPGYRNLCNCIATQTVAPVQSKPCVQGGALLPGESCSVEVQIGGRE
jgi:hypothetical protein